MGDVDIKYHVQNKSGFSGTIGKRDIKRED